MFSSFCFNPVENEKQCSAIDLFQSHVLRCPKLECGLHLLELQDTSRLLCPLESWATEWAWNNLMFICLKLSEVHIWFTMNDMYIFLIYTYRLYVDIFGYYYLLIFVIYPWQTNAQQSNAAWTPRSFFEKVLLLVQMSATPVAYGNDMKWSNLWPKNDHDQTCHKPNAVPLLCSVKLRMKLPPVLALNGWSYPVPLRWINQWLVNLYKSLYKLCQSKS